MRKLQLTQRIGLAMSRGLVLRTSIFSILFIGVIIMANQQSTQVETSPNMEFLAGPGVPVDLPWTCDATLGTIMKPGIVAVTCGTILELAPSERFAFGMFDISGVAFANNRPNAMALDYHHPSWHVDSIGNVFGTAVDKQRNVYLTASTHYGAGFFDAGFGANNGIDATAVIRWGEIAADQFPADADSLMAAGAIYKIDGVTGRASYFTSLPQQAAMFTHDDCESGDFYNRDTGPGLGNIVFDKANNQFFVTNFEDGMIYRLDLNGNVLSTFDPFLPDDGSPGFAPDVLPYGVTVNPTGTRLYFGTHETNLLPRVYSVDLDANGDFSGTETFHISLTGNGTVGVFTANPWIAISDLEYRPDGNLMVGLRTGCENNFATSHNHGGTYYVIGDNDGNGLLDNIIEPNLRIHYPNDCCGPDDGYGGIGIIDNGDGTYTYALSSADILDEPGPHGVIIFPDTYQTDGDESMGEFPLYPSAHVPYFAATTETMGDFKGVGGDVLGFGAPFSSLGNYVWFDINQNGQQDPGEPPVEGMPVYLLDKDMNHVLESDGMTPVSDITDENGIYLIDFIEIEGLTDTFFLEFGFNSLPGTLPSPVQDPAVNDGGAMDDPLDSDLSMIPFGDGFKTDLIILGLDDFISSVDAGIIGTDTLGDYVFVDNNGDGIQNMGDVPLPGVKMYLKFNGVIVDSTTTDMDGHYEFPGLLPDPNFAYSVQIQVPPGYILSQPGQGMDPSVDSDFDLMTLMSPDYIFSNPDESFPDFDAGLFQPVSIADIAWEDKNGDGCKDMDEGGIDGITVSIQDGMGGQVIDINGNMVNPVITAGGGFFTFNNLYPGVYIIQFEVNPNVLGEVYSLTIQDQCADVLLDSDVNEITGFSPPVNIESGIVIDSVSAGYFAPIEIGDTVWVDANGNGLQDLGENPIPDATIELWEVGGLMAITTTTTNVDGRYKFEGLSPGEYYVVVDLSTSTIPNATSYVPTEQNAGMDDAIDSDIDDSLTSTSTLLASGEMDCTLDAGFYLPVSVGDTLWVDANGNGIQDMGEDPIPNVEVELWEVGGVVPVTTTTTNGDGGYKFEGLPPGEYYIVTNVGTSSIADATEYVPTLQNADMDDSVDSDIDGTQTSTSTLLASGEMDCTLDAGFFIPVIVGDTAWVDENGNGVFENGEPILPNVPIQLYKVDDMGVGQPVTEDYDMNPLPTETGMMGEYKFTNLPPGEYYVVFNTPATYTPTLEDVGMDEDVDSDINQMGISDTVMVASGGMDCTLDAGYYVPVSVGDTVWVDANGNGLQDLGESGLDGVTVTLFTAGGSPAVDAQGMPVPPQVTMNGGLYKFTNLPPGQYYTVFNQGLPYFPTIPNAMLNSMDEVDSDIPVTIGTQQSELTSIIQSGGMDCTLDAGYFVPVSVGDTVWVDANGDGLQDPINEPGLGGVGITLYKETTPGTWTAQVVDYLNNPLPFVTNPDGSYKFVNLMPGSYYVKFDVSTLGPDVYYTTYENINGTILDATDSDVNANNDSDTTQFLMSGEMDCTLDAGYFQPVSIGDTAWVDANLNGLQDPMEPGLSGITVTAYYYNPVSTAWEQVTQDIDGNPVMPQVTDANGRYKFENLPPGQYHVQFNSGGIPTTLEDVGGDDLIDSDVNAMELSDTLTVLSGTMDCSFDAGYQGLDYGDLPDEYLTTEGASSGTAPKHVMRDGKFLGSLIDQDSDGQPSPDGDGDDMSGSPYILPPGAGGDDEDGIEFLSPLLPGNMAFIRVTYSTPVDAYLRGWIDYDGDNNAMDDDDLVDFVAIDGMPVGPTDDLLLPASPMGGTVVLKVMVPETAVFFNGNAYTRFRFSCAPGLGPDGLALDGEIEDYVVPLGKLGNIVWQDENYDGLQDINDIEPPIQGVEVVLRYTYDDGGTSFTVVDTVVTAADGTYYFCGLIESTIGKYEVIVITPDGLITTKDNEGMDDTLDSDGDMFFDLGKDSVRVDPFMIMDITGLPTGENGYEDAPNSVSGFPDNQVDQSYDFGFVSIDFGDLPNMDFGDLPASYNEDENGMDNPPSHIVTENKRLGSCVDSEPMEQPDDMGMGDDGNMGGGSQFEFGDCSDPDGDEDGVEFLTPMIPGDTAYVKITYTLPVDPGSDTSGYVQGWIDFDGDGTFNAGDEVVAFSVNGSDLPADTDNIALGAGMDSMIVIGILIPETANFNTGMAFTRWRLSCEGGLAATGVLPSGLPPEGEVEEFVIPLAKVGNLVWLDQNYDGIQDVADEEGIENVEVQLTYTTSITIGMTTIDLTVSDTTYTDENGEYYFCGLIGDNVGEYKLTVISPESFTPTFANEPSVSDSLDSDNTMNIGDTIVMTDIFMIPDPFRMPEGEDGLEDDPNIVNNFPDTLVNQTYDFGFVPLDYGDHDSTYVTVKPDGGPVHVISEIKYLGLGADAEIEADADEYAGAIDAGDDNMGSGYIVPEGALLRDDEDGITFLTPLIPGYKAIIRVEYTLDGEDGFLNGWMDWNGNGMFDHPTEALEFYIGAGVPTTDYALPQGVGQSIDICFDVPADAMFNEGNAHSRFRLSCDGGLLPTGGFPMVPGAPQGEVEDYFVPLAKVGNLAWYDNNLDGDQDGIGVVPTEEGVADVRIYLVYAGYGDNTFEDGNEVIYEVITAGDGTYNFCGLIGGEYQLLPSKYVEGAVTPEDTIPVRYILTIPDLTDQGTENDVDSDFMPEKQFTIPDLLFNDLVNGNDMDPQNENGYLDNPGTINGFPDEQDDLTCDLGYIPEPNIEAILEIPGVQPPASNTCGHFNVILDVCVKNTGYVDEQGVLIGAPLAGPNVNFDFVDLLGDAFVDVVSVEVLTMLEYADDPDPLSMDLPTPNPNFDGSGDTEALAGDGLLLPDEEFCIRVIVEIAPDNLDMMEALALDFSAIATGNAVNYQGVPIPDFFNGGVQFIAQDSSDMMFEFVGGYDDPDEPEPLGDCWKTTRELAELEQVNLSVDQNCELMLDAGNVLVNHMPECDKNEYPLGGFYAISIQDHHQQGYIQDVNGEDVNLVPMATIDGHPWIGEQWKISVHPVSQHCNSTWGYGLVEDKLPPSIICNDVTISCTQALTYDSTPMVDDNCWADIEMVNEVHELIDCDDDYIGTIRREWIATDLYGNQSEVCIQTIYLERTDLSGIMWPASLTVLGNTALECGSGYAEDDNGHPDPSVTGVPKLNGIDLYPFEANLICNGYVNYEDRVIQSKDCFTQIERRWYVGEWWCSSTNEQLNVQVIEIEDTRPPVITVCPGDITVSTDSRTCMATVEMPPVEYNDACGAPVKVNVIAEQGSLNDSNGGFIDFEAGLHTVTYVVQDKCGNSSSCEVDVLVKDEKAPVIICEQDLVVSLGIGGTARLQATDLDLGSFDECTKLTYEARRMSDECDISGTDWGEEVYFCCEDAGEIVMVLLRVTDKSGNTNECMVEVRVQDKLPPRMACIDDITINCNVTYAMNNLSASFGFPEIVSDNCPENNEIRETFVEDVNQCGIGSIHRTFHLYDGNGAFIQECEQWITIEGDTDSDQFVIDWPDDLTADNLCSSNDLHPDNLPVENGWPMVPDDLCSLIGMDYSDEYFDGTTGDEACFKIIRTWKVIDWCNRDESGNGTFIPQWEWEQIIKVTNTNDPVITGDCSNRTFDSYDPDCGDVRVQLSMSGMDDCTPQEDLLIRYEIDEDDDGDIDYRGVGDQVDQYFHLGTHSIKWEVEDRCGNITSCEYDFETRNLKAPIPICIDGLSIDLQAMDLDNDLINETAMAILTPDMIDGKSEDPCGDPITLSFSSDTDSIEMILDCDDVGEIMVELWVTDIHGNQSHCITNILVTANGAEGLCGDGGQVNISGRISTMYDEGIEEVEVSLLGSELPSDMTGSDGEYAFNDMISGGTYDVIPEKNDDPMNGVSTLDIVHIQRHILGISEITDPYLLVAADINGSGSVTATDIIELRKLILGHYEVFPNNTSWRFVDANYEYTDPEAPWIDETPQYYRIAELINDMEIDFIGMKVGDISGDASANGRHINSGNRSDVSTWISIEDEYLLKGETSIVAVRAGEENWKGLQLEMSFSGLEVLEVGSHQLEVSQGHYRLEGERLMLSLNDEEALAGGNSIFYIKVAAHTSGYISEMVSMTEEHFVSEAYVGVNAEVTPVEIRWEEGNDGKFAVRQNVPNPWSEMTRLDFSIPQAGEVKVIIRDVAGKQLKVIDDQYRAGNNSIQLRGDEILATGVLLYEVYYGDERITGRMIKVK